MILGNRKAKSISGICLALDEGLFNYENTSFQVYY